jgi:hypothetical protein
MMFFLSAGASFKNLCPYSSLACKVSGQFLETGMARSSLIVIPSFIKIFDTDCFETLIESSVKRRSQRACNVVSGDSSSQRVSASVAAAVILKCVAPPLLPIDKDPAVSWRRKILFAVLLARPNVLAADDIETCGLEKANAMKRCRKSDEMVCRRIGALSRSDKFRATFATMCICSSFNPL